MSSLRFLRLGNTLINPLFIKSINKTEITEGFKIKVIVANTEQISTTPSGSMVWFDGNDTICRDIIYEHNIYNNDLFVDLESFLKTEKD